MLAVAAAAAAVATAAVAAEEGEEEAPEFSEPATSWVLASPALVVTAISARSWLMRDEGVGPSSHSCSGK